MNMRPFTLLLALSTLLPLTACTSKDPGSSGKLVIGFSQCNAAEPWREVFDSELKAEAKKLGVELLYSDAQNREEQQRQHIESYVQKEVDAILVSPKDAQTQVKAIEAAMDRGIPVVVLDRGINSENYSCYVGGDNLAIGRAAGEYAAKILGGKGKVVEIQGGMASTPGQERSNGFREVIGKHPGIEIISAQEANWFRDEARKVMQNVLRAHEEIDLVYAHNDPMAIGAWLAAKDEGREKKMRFLGIDALPGPEHGCQAVLDGKLDATFLYPTPGARGLQEIVKFLREKKTPQKKVTLETVTITKEIAAKYASR